MKNEAVQDEQFQAVVFRELPTTVDFAQSERFVLAGRYTRAGAWARVKAAVRADRTLVGGTIESVFAESDAEADAEMLPIP